MHIKGSDWNARHRELLTGLSRELAALLGGEAFEPAAYAEAMARAASGFAALAGHNNYYLARSLSSEQKSACARHHCLWLARTFSPCALHRLLTRRPVLWSARIEETVYSAALRPEAWVAREGELTLDFIAGPLDIYHLSFTVAPGRLFGLDDAHALLVSRMQGAPERFDELKQATKALSDVAPRALLFAALTGVARATGIRHIVGVSAENFITYAPEKREALERQYDEFFLALDAKGPEGGFYVLDTSAPPKPVTQVKAGHRIRTRRKRALKEAVAGAAAEAWTSEVLG